jgi:dipeptidyl aminopeptidase/acylaminoacyl peptidase
MLKKVILFLCLGSFTGAFAQQSTLTVEKIMRDPKWMGQSPDGIFWDLQSKRVYFNWAGPSSETPQLHQLAVGQKDPIQVSEEERRSIKRAMLTDKAGKRELLEKNGDIYIIDIKTGTERQLTKTQAREFNPQFTVDEKGVYFMQGSDYYVISLQNAQIEQLSYFSAGNVTSSNQGNSPAMARNQAGLTQNEQNDWLRKDQVNLFDQFKQNNQASGANSFPMRGGMGATSTSHFRMLGAGEGMTTSQQISPNLQYISYAKYVPGEGNTPTIVPNYVTASGYTENLNTRTKVGNALPRYTYHLYDRNRDTLMQLRTSTIPGIKDIPAFYNDYPEVKAKLVQANADRPVQISALQWNDDGTAAIVTAHSQDNKDRWILKVDLQEGGFHLVDRQHDEAWIGGPGIGYGGVQWLDKDHIYFQSEATGYSHIYVANVHTGMKRQITSGNWEVQSLRLSKDKSKFYFTANKKHPGITHYYSISVAGGEPVQITSMDGGNEVILSPDEKWLAIRYSFSNKPWELFVQPNKPGAEAIQITESTSDEFKAYNWREPEVIRFKNRHGSDVYARLYQPAKPKAGNPAVIFVHGAGYLQNVHYWWSQYFREYMFHNLLTDLGYTVLDIDFTASSGYGRDHRTGIYRHMGGKDLSDQVDGAKLLVDKYQVNPKNIGLYGGSYGGFITLMAMFNEPEVFAAGAALRSVTDWAHYNHGYTANILNEPVNDPIAYKRSSPIYFAEGLKGHLLMCHGMLDVNVHYQDIVRLSQRLIELGKDNWELASYPIEDHGFVTPSGWTDEYKRILKLFEERLTN